jgi:hypothetical protein
MSTERGATEALLRELARRPHVAAAECLARSGVGRPLARPKRRWSCIAHGRTDLGAVAIGSYSGSKGRPVTASTEVIAGTCPKSE